MIYIIDTSGVIEAFDRDSQQAKNCAAVLTSPSAGVLSPLVLAEVDHLARRRFGAAARRTILQTLADGIRASHFISPTLTGDLLDHAISVLDSYRDLDLDLADAVNVELARTYATPDILTLDQRDFRAIRPLTGHASFRILPADL